MSRDLVSFSSSSGDHLLTSGEASKGKIHDKIIGKMVNMCRLPNLLEVDGRISINSLVPVIFNKDQVCLSKAKQK